MPSDSRNSTMAKVRAWFFHCSMLLQPERCLLPYHSICNAFFMDLPRPSLVSHSSLFTTKSVDCMWWLPFVTEIVCSSYFDYKSSFTAIDSTKNTQDWKLSILAVDQSAPRFHWTPWSVKNWYMEILLLEFANTYFWCRKAWCLFGLIKSAFWVIFEWIWS